MAAPSCSRGHAMTITTTFAFDHEPGDTARDHARLEQFKAIGLELGARVTLWECRMCREATALFVYPKKENTTP